VTLADAQRDTRTGTAPVRLGRVDYVNVLPVYMGLDEEGTRCSIVAGVPTDLNSRLRAREIDCAPVSAIEVAHARGQYAMLPGLSISSVGPVGSSMLISKRAPNELDGASVALTTHSAASLAYFRILCAKLWRVQPRTVDAAPDLDSMLAAHDACVLIGNPAIRAVDVAERRGDLHITDLGAAWFELTELPCIFAVWALWRDWAAEFAGDAAVLREDLERGRAWGVDPAHRAALDARGAAETGLSVAQLHDYFDKQDYRLDAAHERGLRRFYDDLADLDLAPRVASLEFAP
jgi:chorismate dehydratase